MPVAPPKFENFVQVAVKGFLAMNELTPSLPARNQGGYETVRFDAVRLGVLQVGRVEVLGEPGVDRGERVPGLTGLDAPRGPLPSATKPVCCG